MLTLCSYQFRGLWTGAFASKPGGLGSGLSPTLTDVRLKTGPLPSPGSFLLSAETWLDATISSAFCFKIIMKVSTLLKLVSAEGFKFKVLCPGVSLRGVTFKCLHFST